MSIVAAVLPSIILGLYIWIKDPQKEPVFWLVKAFVLGCVLIIPAILIEREIEIIQYEYFYSSLNFINVLINAFIATAIPEESLKLLALWFILRKNPYFDEHFDGIVYAVFIGLGFAAIENAIYLYDDDNWITTSFLRSLLSVPGHYAFAIMMGYYYSIYCFVKRSKKNAVCILLVPVVAHGIFDTLASSGRIAPVVGVIGFFVLVVFCVWIHWIGKNRILLLIKKDKK